MHKKLILLISFQLFAFSQGDFNADYKIKSTFDLRKYGMSFVELSNSRVNQGNLNIELNIDNNKSEKYEVKLTAQDFTSTKSLKSVGNRLSFDNKKVDFKQNYTRKESLSLFSNHLRNEVWETLKKIDANILFNKLDIKISEIDFTCSNINDNNKECILESKIKISYKTLDAGKIGLLKGHLNQLKSEMTRSNNDYDIVGYREFLSKCEGLVKELLENKNYSNNKKLVEVRKMIIDERVDSYEYTAIRAVSISRFVDGILKHI